MASRDALPFPTDGHVVVDRPVPAPLGDPANTAPGHGFSDRHVVVDGRESSSAAAYLQTASTLSQNHRTQVLPSPSSHPSRARDSLSSDDRRVDSIAAIHGDRSGLLRHRTPFLRLCLRLRSKPARVRSERTALEGTR